MLTSTAIKSEARDIGFDLCGIAPVADHPELHFLPEWLARGYAGRMTYLNRTARRRADARAWLASARSVVVVACLYNTCEPLSVERADPGEAAIARYGWGDDYHHTMGRRLERLLDWMRSAAGEPFDAVTSVDTGPVQERVYAQHAGLGWIGKNTCVVNPDLGSWLLLGAIVTSLDLEPDTPGLDQCGTCRLCLDACPTRAIVEPHVLDATKCLSYLTIEIRGGIPEDQRASLGAHVFGCDICQDVCPFNLQAPVSAAGEWQPRPALRRPSLAALWRMSDDQLARAIAGTALERAGVAGLRRNIAVALGNAGTPEARDTLDAPRPADDAPSLADPIVAAHVAWAAGRRH
ncbi:MAG: tRNA epoxyqueuosine(34) reductase QueG [Acidobacteriota bacterium]